ncbi:MAG: hypothetical protein GY854_00035 [Deltaproteobacteria bacterium]|nr:hypothetical protein [Deltaproteobacteria bacterium]
MVRRRGSHRLSWLGMVIAFLIVGCFDDPSMEEHICDTCRPCESCLANDFGTLSCEAAERSYKKCGDDGNVHWYDSCGTDEDLAEQCPTQNAECVNVSDSEAECSCLHHWEGSNCTTCPGN